MVGDQRIKCSNPHTCGLSVVFNPSAASAAHYNECVLFPVYEFLNTCVIVDYITFVWVSLNCFVLLVLLSLLLQAFFVWLTSAMAYVS